MCAVIYRLMVTKNSIATAFSVSGLMQDNIMSQLKMRLSLVLLQTVFSSLSILPLPSKHSQREHSLPSQTIHV
jgi:hypothetical protein